MTELVVKRVVDNNYLTIIKISSSSLTVEQIQVMTGLIFAINMSKYQCENGSLNLCYQLDGNTMINTDIADVYTWSDTGIIRSHTFDSELVVYQRSQEGEHLVLSGIDNEALTVTFKNGRLDSVGDRAAIYSIWATSVGGATALWFTNDICYRSANPQYPSRESGNGYHNICYHHNAEGKVFRDPSAGLAAYHWYEFDDEVTIEPL